MRDNPFFVENPESDKMLKKTAFSLNENSTSTFVPGKTP